MVHAVGLVQALEVAAPGDVAEWPALVHQAVVGDEVQGAVGGHAGADPFEGVVAARAEPDQGDGDPGEHHGVQVVLFEPAGARLVVRAVPAPPEAVHHVLVRDDGKHFHERDGGQDDERVGKHNEGCRSGLTGYQQPIMAARAHGCAALPQTGQTRSNTIHT